ncbi:hypothetical protein ACB094_05G192400 [Castanea mollissima]
MWNDDDLQRKESWSARKYRCDNYGHCGPNSKCVLDSEDNSSKFECTCLPGYEPKSPKDWYLRDGSGGCVRKQPGFSMCGNGEGFVKLTRLKGPDSFNAAWMDMSMSSSECEKACLSNCSCTASMNIDGKGTRCLAWYGELMDISENTLEPWDLNVRVDATELATYTRNSKGFLGPKERRAVIIISISVPLFLVSLIAYIWLMKRKKKDPTRSSLLNWRKRFEIIIGIARGILYLHQESRVRIIHRDLKTSNILLDGEMNPKISYFGIARIFKGDQIQDKTNRVVGTYGYMSPEYAVFGNFSTKSNVFSFGVILLEIISGQKNNSSY